MTSIDHERCSELLRSYVAGELSDDDVTAVAEHLATCEQCRREHAALERLWPEEDVTLTPDERTRVRRGVMAAIGHEDAAPVVSLRQRKGFGARAAAVLGAAAAITVIGAFVYLGVMGAGSDDADTAGRSGGDTTQQFNAGAPEAEEERSAADRKTRSKKGTVADTAGTSLDAAAAPQPRPGFMVATDPYTSAELEKLGESGLPTVMIARFYNARDADSSVTLLEQLVAAARNRVGDDIAEQVETCAARVLDSEKRIVPTFGAAGEFDSDDAVIVGFAWTTRSSGRLNRYMVWAWAEGDCDVTLEYIEGFIETAN